MTDFSKLNIQSAAQGLKSKAFSSSELPENFIKKIEENKQLNCFITSTFDFALDMAKKSDLKLKEYDNIGLLEGVPIGMKDLFCTKDIRTTAGSKMLEKFIPFYESTVSQNLWDSGVFYWEKQIWMNL